MTSLRTFRTANVLYKTKTTKKKKNKAPTHGAGATAEKTLVGRVPLFPSSSTRRLPYFEQAISMTGTAGVIAQYEFTANGLFDPRVAFGGHQPLGFDTMMVYYEQYTVLDSKITVRAVNNGTQAVVVSICLAPDTTPLALPDIVENGLIKMMVLDGRGNGGYGTGQRIGEISLNCDVARYFGRQTKRELLDDVNLYGTVAANPTEQVYFVINTWGFGTFTDNTSVSLDAVLSYNAEFWEPRKVAAMLKRQNLLRKDEDKKEPPPSADPDSGKQEVPDENPEKPVKPPPKLRETPSTGLLSRWAFL